MFRSTTNFINAEDGAVTVDWVVLCAGIVAIAVAIFTSLETSTMSLTDSIVAFMNSFFS